MSHTLLELLAEEALRGNKPSSTFRPETFARVVVEINKKFPTVECLPEHITSHLKTVKKEWTIISTIRGKSGFGWDDNLKMITAAKDVYDEEVTAHPNHEKYLNKKIEMYDEMKIIVGKDIATGSFAKSFNDIVNDTNTEISSTQLDDDDDMIELEEVERGKETSSSSQKRSHRKRKRNLEDDSIQNLAMEVKEVAIAIKNLNKNQLVVSDLYEEVMKTDGFDEVILATVFDHLVQNEMIAKAFMVKNSKLRKIWIENFIRQYRD